MTDSSQGAGAFTSGVRGRALLAAVAVAVAGGGAWLYGRKPAVEAPAPSAVEGAASAVAWPGSAPQAVASAVQLTSAAAASVPASRPDYGALAKKAMDEANSPSEALRKVQLALNGGTPQEVLEAARTLLTCSWAAGAPEALYAVRDRPDSLPEPLRQVFDKTGGISNDTLEYAQKAARRCQVFDAATMARRNELFQRAWEGGAEGGAAAYLSALQSPLEKDKPDPALLSKLRADVRKAAAAGDADSLLHMANATGDQARELSVTPAQRVAYKAAWKTILNERYPGVAMGDIIDKAAAPFSSLAASAPALTAAEQRDADALARQVVDNWRSQRKGR